MSSAIFTAAIILGAVLVFILFFKHLHKKGHNKKLAHRKVVFDEIVYKNKLAISEKETINDYLLAVDKVNLTLLYINFGEQKDEVDLLDLRTIKTVKVATEDNSFYEQRKGRPVLVDKQVNKLQLEVTLAANQKINLVLYEYKDGMQDFSHIRQRAGHWADIINITMKELHQPSSRIPEEV